MNVSRLSSQLRDRAPLLLLLVTCITIGCGSRPIPLTAQAGTTFVLMLPNDLVPGFGLVWTSDPNEPIGGPILSATDPELEDLQRGELLIDAYDPNDPSQARHRLLVRYITRVGVEPTSSAALARTREAQDPNFDISVTEESANWDGQIIAFVDIPASVPAGEYEILLAEVKRTAGDEDNWDALPTVYQSSGGWDSGEPVRLRILAADPNNLEQFSQLEGGDKGGWGLDVESRLRTMVPNPEVRIDLWTLLAPPFGVFRPAAAEIEVTYPAGRVAIVGVALGKNDPSAAVVRWEASGPTGPGCSATGTLKIHMVDPDVLTSWLRVAFHHPDPLATCPTRVQPSDFVIDDPDGWIFYTGSGAEVTNSLFKPIIVDQVY